jgi:hypothetical protein
MRPIFLFCFFTFAFSGYAQQKGSFENQLETLLHLYVTDGLIDYHTLKDDPRLSHTYLSLADAPDTVWSDSSPSFLVNAYNLSVIREISRSYPISTVREIPGFFDRKRHLIAGKSITLDQLEQHILNITGRDPAIHFVLVCGAVGCPPIISEVYRHNNWQSLKEKQTRTALNHPEWVRVDHTNQQVSLSELFKWYFKDFASSNEELISWMNQYRADPIPANYALNFYNYDWSLNAKPNSEVAGITATNTARYVVSSTIPRGRWEHKLFANLYRENKTRQGLEQHNAWFTTFLTSLYGFSNRFNAGLEMRYRSVRQALQSEGPFAAITGADRRALATLGPVVRWAPVKAWTAFSIQSALWIPLRNDLSGSSAFLDWNGATWWTRAFNDWSVGRRYALFTEVSFMMEDLGATSDGRINRISTPVNLIGSFFPTTRSTVYGLVNYSPYWYPQFDGFFQAGVGTKYQFTPRFEVELLATWFTNGDLIQNGGQASTWNLGFRWN